MTFYFYDLETSGINPRAQRIMQFAGQRTDEHFKPIGEPQNWLVKLTDEVLPDPDAVLITGITPQKTLQDGYSEAEFLKLFYEEVLQPDTILMGFNSIRFDDEFMRATLWRNFYDPYQWQWQDGRTRWDLLDVVRMIRALRPEGIEWPFEERLVSSGDQAPKSASKQAKLERIPTNRLELLTKANGLDHQNAHDALSDVRATILVAQLLNYKQPKIFNYLLEIRTKKQVQALISSADQKPFLYCSGRYSNNWLKTTAVVPVADGSNGGVLVYDLRQDPTKLANLSDDELIEKLFSRNVETEILPVKNLKSNSCPAVAPLGVLDEASQQRLELPLKTIKANYNKLQSLPGFTERVGRLYQKHDQLRRQEFAKESAKESDPDFQIYDGFVAEEDKIKMRAVRAASEKSLATLDLSFKDERLKKLLPRYKARNYPSSISGAEREAWDEYRRARITNGLPGQLSLERYAARLSELLTQAANDDRAQFLLQELKLYVESIVPISD